MTFKEFCDKVEADLKRETDIEQFDVHVECGCSVGRNRTLSFILMVQGDGCEWSQLEALSLDLLYAKFCDEIVSYYLPPNPAATSAELDTIDVCGPTECKPDICEGAK